MSFVTHLEAAIDGTELPANVVQTLYKDRPIWVRYDLHKISTCITKEDWKQREPTMWRYRELLPIFDNTDIVSLGETITPLLSCPRLGSYLGLDHLYIKDESHLPTGSFKSRGMAMAITMAKQFNISKIALPSAGNAGGAAAAYGARAGTMNVYVFMPDDTPIINQYECKLAGAKTFLVNGLITDCGKIVKQGKDVMKWFDLSTLKEPYRIEGKKTMGLELAEQFDWKLPDVILYPTGGGTGLIGMYKAFQELKTMGWLVDDKLPRMVAVQSDGCCPIVQAYEAGERFAKIYENANSIASGIRVPAAIGDFMILDTIRESNGCAIAVNETRIREYMEMAISKEGISICPEAAACVGAIEKLLANGWLKRNERVVIFNTGAAQKYVEAITPITDLPKIDLNKSIKWDKIK